MRDIQGSKYFDYLIVMVFMLSIAIPLIGSISIPDRKMSLVEKRILETAPDSPDSIKTLRRYPDKFNLYYQDHFGYRDEFLHLYYRIKYAIGDSASRQVIFGKNGWLFFQGPDDLDLINVTRNIRVLSENELEKYATSLQAKHLWLKSQGIEYLFAIAPNKHSIYPEYLPDHLYKIGDRSLTDNLLDHVRMNTDVTILDLRAQLLAAKSDDRLLYFPTDTHWNYLGANIAQYEIAKAIASIFPERIKPKLYDYSEFTQTDGPGGDLSAFIDLRDNFVEIYPSPVFTRCQDVMLSKNAQLKKHFSTRCDPNGLNIVVFRDSFFKWLQPYISQYANRATFIWNRMQPEGIEDLIKQESPDIVIETWVERSLIRVPSPTPPPDQQNPQRNH